MTAPALTARAHGDGCHAPTSGACRVAVDSVRVRQSSLGIEAKRNVSEAREGVAGNCAADTSDARGHCLLCLSMTASSARGALQSGRIREGARLTCQEPRPRRDVIKKEAGSIPRTSCVGRRSREVSSLGNDFVGAVRGCGVAHSLAAIPTKSMFASRAKGLLPLLRPSSAFDASTTSGGPPSPVSACSSYVVDHDVDRVNHLQERGDREQNVQVLWLPCADEGNSFEGGQADEHYGADMISQVQLGTAITRRSQLYRRRCPTEDMTACSSFIESDGDAH